MESGISLLTTSFRSVVVTSRLMMSIILSLIPLPVILRRRKHRMGKIRDPPNIYDVVQLASYCRVFGLVEGVLVQCLRGELAGGDVGQLHVMPLDFSEGSTD